MNIEAEDCFEGTEVSTLAEAVVGVLQADEADEELDDETYDTETLTCFENRKWCIDVTMRLLLDEDEPNFAPLTCLRPLGALSREKNAFRKTDEN